MDSSVKIWRESGKHLPAILRDFHDQKAVFRLMHEMLGEPAPSATIKRPNWVEGQCYVLDCFLWFMARHGYTLQRSRAGLPFDSLESNLAAMEKYRVEQFKKMLASTEKPAE